MNNKNKVLVSIIVSVVLIAAIIFAMVKLVPKFYSKYDGDITIIVINDKEEKIYEKKIGFNEGDSFLDILERNLTVEYETSQFGKFIVSIKDLKQYDDFYWVYTRNGEFTTTGVELQEFIDGDIFVFELKNFG